MEAADDVSYRIIDLEDAYKARLVTTSEILDLLFPLVEGTDGFPWKRKEFSARFPEDVRVYKIRVAAVYRLAKECLHVFGRRIRDIEDGVMKTDLISVCRSRGTYEKLREFMRERIYPSRTIVRTEAAGFKVISGLLDIFASAFIFDRHSRESFKIRLLFPTENVCAEGPDSRVVKDQHLGALSDYNRLLAVTDFICGMTDRYAVELFQRLSGIKL